MCVSVLAVVPFYSFIFNLLFSHDGCGLGQNNFMNTTKKEERRTRVFMNSNDVTEEMRADERSRKRLTGHRGDICYRNNNELTSESAVALHCLSKGHN